MLLGGLTVAYAMGWRRLRKRGGREWATIPRAIAFIIGINTLVLALVSPLHHLGTDYLLSAHMVQHMMVGDIAPHPALPRRLRADARSSSSPSPILRWAGGPGMRPVIRQLGRPQMAFWRLGRRDGRLVHPGRLRRARSTTRRSHYLMWSTIFITGVAVWSHILAMVPGMRMSNAKRAGYAVGLLFAGMIISEFLFLNDPLYQLYVDQPDRLLRPHPRGRPDPRVAAR